jgi:hypothetical protein
MIFAGDGEAAPQLDSRADHELKAPFYRPVGRSAGSSCPFLLRFPPPSHFKIRLGRLPDRSYPPMGNCCGSVAMVPSEPQVTELRPSAPVPLQRTITSRRKDHPPPSSEGDVFISQHPDRLEMRSRQYPSGGAAPMQRTRSVSMDVTALKGAPSTSSGRRNRTTSTAVQGNGHQRVRTKSISSATSQTLAERQGGRSHFPFALQSLLPNDFRYAVRP